MTAFAFTVISCTARYAKSVTFSGCPNANAPLCPRDRCPCCRGVPGVHGAGERRVRDAARPSAVANGLELSIPFRGQPHFDLDVRIARGRQRRGDAAERGQRRIHTWLLHRCSALPCGSRRREGAGGDLVRDRDLRVVERQTRERLTRRRRRTSRHQETRHGQSEERETSCASYLTCSAIERRDSNPRSRDCDPMTPIPPDSRRPDLETSEASLGLTAHALEFERQRRIDRLVGPIFRLLQLLDKPFCLPYIEHRQWRAAV